MIKYLEKLRGKEKIWIAPQIPPKKAQNAIKSYCYGIEYNDILAILDETVFGSCSNGVTLTTSHLLVKENFEKPQAFALDSINSCYAKRGILECGLYVNDSKVLGLTQISYADMSLFCDCVRQIIENAKNHLDPKEGVGSENYLNIYQEDRFFQVIKDTEESLIRSIFSVNSFGGSLGMTVRLYVWKMIHFVRTNYIDKNRIRFLQNNIASLELVVYFLAILACRLRELLIPVQMIELVLNEGARGVLNSDDTLSLPEIAMKLSELEDYVLIIAFGLYPRLIVGNIRGKIPREQVTISDLEEIAWNVLGLDFEDCSDQERVAVILGAISNWMEKIGLSITDNCFNSTLTRTLEHCVSDIVKTLKETYGSIF